LITVSIHKQETLCWVLTLIFNDEF